MAILQALFSFVRGSAGKALNAIFGWAVLALFEVWPENPDAHRRAPVLRTRRDEIARELFGTPLEYDEFQVVYRELLQLDRALRGEAALLDAAASRGE